MAKVSFLMTTIWRYFKKDTGLIYNTDKFRFTNKELGGLTSQRVIQQYLLCGFSRAICQIT